MLKFIVLVISVLTGFCLGNLCYSMGYAKGVKKAMPVIERCTQYLETASDIITSGQYCDSFCAEAFENMAG